MKCADGQPARALETGDAAPPARALAAPFATTPVDELERTRRIKRLKSLLEERIVLLDGAMGTMIQSHRLDEAGYRGERFRDYGRDLKGNNDLLTLSRPEIIADIHRAYFEAGADIVETNTFNSTAISQADYGTEALVPELNYRAAQLARAVADEFTRKDGRVALVAGALGPTSRMASLSPDVNDPGFRSVSFDELVATYAEAARALVLGGADLLIVETVFDTLNAKAALYAVHGVLNELARDLPLIISGTITDASGRTLSRGRPPRRSGTQSATQARSPSVSIAHWARRSCGPMCKSFPAWPTLTCAPIRMQVCRMPSANTTRHRKKPRPF